MLRPKWETLLYKYFKQRLPDDYVAFDLETTGFKKDFDLPIDCGWCIVENRKPVQRGSFLLDWTRRPEWVDPIWLEDRLAWVRSNYSRRGVAWDYTPSVLSQGEDPRFVLDFYYEMLERAFKEGHKIIGQNICAFDCPMLTFVFNEFLDAPWPVPDEGILDTGCLEKAILSYDILNPELHLNPKSGEAPSEFFKRCFNKRVPGAKWNLDECVHRYELDRLYEEFNSSRLHCAEADSFACHLLLELNRE
jgi:DNA polymerase III epsilon subunit-like protein